MENNSLKLEKRNEIGGGRGGRLRKRGQVPAVVYGGDMQAVPARVNASELKGFIKHNGRNAVFNTEFAEEHDLSVLIKDIQYDPVNKEIIHLDLQRVNPQERVTVDVPVRVIGGDSVMRAGNVIMHQLDAVKVECLPGNIPKYVEADISGLTPGHSFTAGDLKFTDKISLISRPGEIIATVNGRAKETEAEPEAAAGQVQAEGQM
jgi:large subunit ribosomal protein L25